jgi:hypothetical protein
MAQLKFELKSPFIPLFQRGSFLFRTLNPSFEKRGRGRFVGMAKELCGEFLRQDTSDSVTLKK